MESITQVVQVYELERKGYTRDVCSVLWWLGS